MTSITQLALSRGGLIIKVVVRRYHMCAPYGLKQVNNNGGGTVSHVCPALGTHLAPGAPHWDGDLAARLPRLVLGHDHAGRRERHPRCLCLS